MNPKGEMVPQEGSEGDSSPVDPSTKKNPVGIKVTKGEFHASSFRGPIPPPWILKGYEEVFPGCAERIVAMAEKQSSRRKMLEQERHQKLKPFEEPETQDDSQSKLPAA